MLALAEKQMLIQALGQVVLDEVQSAIKPLQDRLSGVERMLDDMPVPRDGKDGVDGKDGTSIKFDDVVPIIEGTFSRETTVMKDWTREYVMGALEALPKPEKGEKGEKGDPGEKG